MNKLEELAERCEREALSKLGSYLKTNERRSNWNGDDLLDSADKLLNIAASLRARSMKEGSHGEE